MTSPTSRHPRESPIVILAKARIQARNNAYVDVAFSPDQIGRMAHLQHNDLRKIGRNAARRVFGAGKVKDVDVMDTDALDEQPAYLFSFLYDGVRDRQQMPSLRSRLSEKLRDELLARGDDGYPLIRVLSPQEWEKRQLA